MEASISSILNINLSANEANIAISTVVLIITTIGLYLSLKEKKEKLEHDVIKSFLKHEVWTNVGVFDGEDSEFFELYVDDPHMHIFKGEIRYSNFPYQKQPLVFQFEKVKKNNIFLKLRKTEGYKDFGSGYSEFGSAKAQLKLINPDLFQIIFSKGYGLKKGRFTPDLPRKTQIIPDRVNGNEVNITQNNPSDKVLTNDIIDALSPERNYAKVKELLGEPDKTIMDSSIFEESTCSEKELEYIKSDMYFLKNAKLKITTLDERSIHSITVFSHDGKLTLPRNYNFYDMGNIVIGEAQISKESISNARIESVRTRIDSATAIQNHMGSPVYKHLTYFIDGHLDDEQDPDYMSLAGSRIKGFCLSDSDLAFYIYDYELR